MADTAELLTRKLDLNLLNVLYALLTECNLTYTAERLGVTQPAVSAALRRLRENYDDPLLMRTGRGFRLTRRAERLLPVIAHALAAAEHTFDVLPTTFDPATSTRTFHISASDYVLSEITAPLLGVIASEAPHVRIRFEGLLPTGDISPVELLRHDVTVAAGGRDIPGKHISLFSDRFVCIVDASNPALRNGRLSLSAIASLRHVRSEFGTHATTHVDDMLLAAGLTPRAAATVRGLLSVPFLVAGTPWIGWVPERTAQRWAGPLGLVVAETPIAPSVLIEAAHWHPSKTKDIPRQWLVEKLRRASEVVEFGDDH